MGIRVIKTALAALAALYTASWLGLDPPLSAGLLAILGVEVTRMRGLKSALARFVASALGLFFASVLFMLLGFHLWTISLFILLVFPILSRVHLKEGIVTSSVIVFHIYAREQVNAELIGNEIMLLLTGLGWASIINLLYMPKEEKRLESLRTQVEEQLGAIFLNLAASLRDPSYVWQGRELLEAGALIDEGLRRAGLNRENKLWGPDDSSWRYWPTYFEMRRQQLGLVQRMLPPLAFVYETLPQGELVAALFEHLADGVKSPVYAGEVERELGALEQRFKDMPLPHTRDEFEARAAIFQMMHELDSYLEVARRLKKH